MSRPTVKTAAEIASMRAGGRILAQVLQTVAAAVKPGVSEIELSNLAQKEVESLGGQPAFLGHQGFPAPICISVNEKIVHGIPSKDTLRQGDIVSLDMGVRYASLITDGAITVPVGEVDDNAKRLMDGTYEALTAGIKAARNGNRVGDISVAIERVLRRHNLNVIEALVGHGVGYELWEEPHVPNYGLPHQGPALKPGMTLAIEPMASLGDHRISVDAGDGWTIRTLDGSLAAQFEHTVVITADGSAEILTKTD